MAKILVTGAAGFVGSALAQLLIRNKHDVRLIDDYYIPSNITSIENVPIEKVDIRDETDISEFDILFHLAAISGIKRCEKNEHEAFEVNVKGTYNLLKTLKGRIVFASTSAVYGEAAHPLISEMHPVIPLGSYGNTKLEAEKLVKLHPRFIILRFSNIYGRGLFCKRTVTDTFVEKALKKEMLEIHGDGRQRRDFIHINDVLVAYWNAMRTPVNGTFNIGGNEALSVNDIAELVIKQYRNIFGYKLGKQYIAEDTGRKWKDFIYSSQKAKEQLNYEPSYSVSDEIRQRFIAYSKVHR